eukprot:6181532-Pleurochrysis_carterae.AAC.5
MVVTAQAEDLPVQTEWARSAVRARWAREVWQQREAGCSCCEKAASATAAAASMRRVRGEQGLSVRVTAQVMVTAIHPGGRPHPHPTHVLEQPTQLAQHRCVRTVCERALDPFHRSDGLVARQKEHAHHGSDEGYS